MPFVGWEPLGAFAQRGFGRAICPPWPEHHLALRSPPLPGCLKGPLVQLGPEQGGDCACVPQRSGLLLQRPRSSAAVTPAGSSLHLPVPSWLVGSGEATPGEDLRGLWEVLAGR